MFSQNIKSTALNMIKLKNGAVAPETAVIATMTAIGNIKEDVVLLYELLEKCRNPNHPMYGSTESSAQKKGLMTDGKIHEYTRDIILSAVEETAPLTYVVNSPAAVTSSSSNRP